MATYYIFVINFALENYVLHLAPCAVSAVVAVWEFPAIQLQKITSYFYVKKTPVSVSQSVARHRQSKKFLDFFKFGELQKDVNDQF